MLLKKIIETYNTKLSELEHLVKGLTPKDFSLYTQLMQQAAPIYAQAHLLEHIRRGGTAENFHEDSFYRLRSPDLYTPTPQEMEVLSDIVIPFITRVHAFAAELDKVNNTHSSPRDSLLFQFACEVRSSRHQANQPSVPGIIAMKSPARRGVSLDNDKVSIYKKGSPLK